MIAALFNYLFSFILFDGHFLATLYIPILPNTLYFQLIQIIIPFSFSSYNSKIV